VRFLTRFSPHALRRAPCAQTRNKKLGIATFDVHEDPFEPGTFHFWERYETVAAMAAYNSSETQQAFEAQARPSRKASGTGRCARGRAAWALACAAGGAARVRAQRIGR
jgi:hypothetical protein